MNIRLVIGITGLIVTCSASAISQSRCYTTAAGTYLSPSIQVTAENKSDVRQWLFQLQPGGNVLSVSSGALQNPTNANIQTMTSMGSWSCNTDGTVSATVYGFYGVSSEKDNLNNTVFSDVSRQQITFSSNDGGFGSANVSIALYDTFNIGTVSEETGAITGYVDPTVAANGTYRGPDSQFMVKKIYSLPQK